jgi:hypothetical protein
MTRLDLQLLLWNADEAMRKLQGMRDVLRGGSPDDAILFELRARLDVQIELLKALRALLSGETAPVGWLFKACDPSGVTD